MTYPCPNGTFSNETSLKAEEECANCTAGWACVGTALLEPNTLCQEGYYCQGKAKTPTPLDTITGDVCPEGFYCPTGTGTSSIILSQYVQTSCFHNSVISMDRYYA